MIVNYPVLNEFDMGWLPPDFWRDETALDMSGERCYNCGCRASIHNPVVVNIDTGEKKCMNCSDKEDDGTV